MQATRNHDDPGHGWIRDHRDHDHAASSHEASCGGQSGLSAHRSCYKDLVEVETCMCNRETREENGIYRNQEERWNNRAGNMTREVGSSSCCCWVENNSPITSAAAVVDQLRNAQPASSLPSFGATISCHC